MTELQTTLCLLFILAVLIAIAYFNGFFSGGE